MNPDLPIAFQQACQAFVCDQYSSKNFVAFLEANAASVQAPEEIEPARSLTGEKRLLLKLRNESQRLDQEGGGRPDLAVPRGG